MSFMVCNIHIMIYVLHDIYSSKSKITDADLTREVWLVCVCVWGGGGGGGGKGSGGGVGGRVNVEK